MRASTHVCQGVVRSACWGAGWIDGGGGSRNGLVEYQQDSECWKGYILPPHCRRHEVMLCHHGNRPSVKSVPVLWWGTHTVYRSGGGIVCQVVSTCQSPQCTRGAPAAGFITVRESFGLISYTHIYTRSAAPNLSIRLCVSYTDIYSPQHFQRRRVPGRSSSWFVNNTTAGITRVPSTSAMRHV